METLARSLQVMGHSLLDFAYPPHCAVCGAHIEAAALLCAECWLAIEKARSTLASVNVAEPELADFKFIKNIILGEFSGVLQEAIYALKFRNQPQLGRELGRRMGVWRAESLAEVDYLLPVPLHPARMRERGYNQSEEIAIGLAEVLGVPMCNGILHRAQNTRQQALLSAAERDSNLRGAFVQVGKLPAGARIAVVDDVLTTGTTLQACAETLQTDRLWAIVLARPRAAEIQQSA